MQAFTVRSQLALFVGKASPCGEVAFAVLPGKTPLASLLGATFLIEVLRVVGAPLAVQLAFQAAFRACIGFEFRAERQQSRFALAWHNGNSGGSQIKPDHVRSYRVLGFPVRFAF